MSKYIIELRCWDGCTTVEIELNESQKEAIELLSTKTQEKSKCGGEPAMYISPSLGERKCQKCGTIMDQNIEDYSCPECFFAEHKSEL